MPRAVTHVSLERARERERARLREKERESERERESARERASESESELCMVVLKCALRTYTYIRTHISPCVCAHVCAYIFRTGIHTKASLPCIPTPRAPLLPPQNDLDQSYSASTSSSVLQLFASPLSINLPPSPPLHAVDSISPPKFATEACNIYTNRGPIVSWKNACRR